VDVERPRRFRRYRLQLSEDELAVWRTFSLAHSHLMKTLDDALREEHAISFSEYEVLYELARAPDGRLRMAELADRLLFTRGGITRVVSRLEDDGYLRRGTVDDDLRGVTAELTDEGYDVFAAAARGHVARVRSQLLEPVGGDSRAFLRALRRILSA
jgi:DNA-binding MarR family transcriptional regulator